MDGPAGWTLFEKVRRIVSAKELYEAYNNGTVIFYMTHEIGLGSGLRPLGRSPISEALQWPYVRFYKKFEHSPQQP